MESRSFGPSNKSKIKQKTPPTNLQYLFEDACLSDFTIDLIGRFLLRSAVQTRQWALWHDTYSVYI